MEGSRGERGVSLIESIIVVGLVGLIFAAAVAAIHTSFNSVRQSGSTTADVVHSVAADARAALAYDSSAPSKFVNATWTVDSKTLATGCASTTPSCVQVTSSVSGSVLTLTAKNLTTNESSSEIVYLHQEATDPTSSAYNGA